MNKLKNTGEEAMQRSWNDDDEVMAVFKRGGLVENTERSRNNWGKRFEEYLNLKKLSMNDMSSKITLASHLERFYYGLKKKNGKPYEVSSIRTSVGPLSKYLSENIPNLGAGIMISIALDNEFEQVRKMLNSVCKDGAKEGRNVGKGKPIIYPEQEIQIVQSFDVLTPLGLLEKALYIVSKYGLLRGNGCYGFMRSWVEELKQNSIRQRSFRFTLPAEKNNQRNLSKQGGARVFQIPYENEDDNSDFALYLSKIPSNYNTKELFLRPATETQALIHDYWYEDREASKTLVTEFIQRAAKKLNLGAGNGSGYTGHSIRASVITHLAADGAQDSDIMDISGHRSIAGLMQYKKNETQKIASLAKLKLPSAPISNVSKKVVPVLKVLQPSVFKNIENPAYKQASFSTFRHKKPLNPPFKPPTFRKL